jgi:ABC-type branched-subunit amino acid transport system substrate-binding protein
VAAVLALAACSSSGSGGSTSNATPANPITIFDFGQHSAPTFAFPNVPKILQAEVAAVNAAGGVNGHQIKLTVCNDQGTLPGATDCARQGTGSDAVAAIADFTLFSGGVLPLFQQAGMAMVGNQALDPADYTNPVSFATVSPTAFSAGIVQHLLENKSCKVLAFVHVDTPLVNTAKPLIQKLVDQAGVKLLDENVGSGASDYGPVAAKISQAGSTCSFIFLGGTDVVKYTIAQKQRNPNFVIGGSTGSYAGSVLKQLGSARNNLVLGAGIPDVSDTSNPEVSEFTKQATGAGVAASDLGANDLQAWASLKLLLGAIGTVRGKVDKAAVLKAMNSITTPATTIFGAYNTTKENSQKDFSRAFATTTYLYSTNNGKLTPIGSPVNVRNLFN